ncbi:MarR family winged helix-turn-helix transcriptional regulator [Nocardioides mangrovi]|uniref:MarR family transcriptional regulator n=1 Tax=Nocardioides mangrovi TaxID=2874580 RepID=A0ABS7U784_9ACTN|nr:MarR family transcriptional regulator [Nocardioides mangrovi]MBZ5736685.1 MarR family transcriptional regulator [Nocardioides mangrovi]
MSAPHPAADALVTALGAVTRRLRQTREAEDLGQPESIALASLRRNGATSSAELARIENIRPQSMHATVVSLERQGLVSRSPDPADGRRMLVELTAAGHAEARSKRSARRARVAEVLARDFTAEERATLLAAAPLLERLAKGM